MIGIIGGTGFYELLENAEEKTITTPYGNPSAPLKIGKIGSKKVIFIPRHGSKHEYPPHKVPYKANIWALKELGVTRIISITAVGSLKSEIKPGDIVIPDQVVNFTRREDTFYNGPETTHISFDTPFCPEMRKSIIDTLNDTKEFCIHKKGTVIVIQGPRFSTIAESNFYRSQGWDIINMTIYPECVLARELELCYANISLVTDYDTGLKNDPNIKPVSTEEVIRVFKENSEKLKTIIKSVVKKIPEERNCICSKALDGAKISN